MKNAEFMIKKRMRKYVFLSEKIQSSSVMIEIPGSAKKFGYNPPQKVSFRSDLGIRWIGWKEEKLLNSKEFAGRANFMFALDFFFAETES